MLKQMLKDNQTPADADCDGFRTVRNAQFVEDGGDVEFDGVVRDLQPPGNFLVSETCC